MDPAVIEFHYFDFAIRENFPKPFPAVKGVPDWFKEMPIDKGGDESYPTVKRCPPFLEAMTSGYLIPIGSDCFFSRKADGNVEARCKFKLVDSHSDFQVQGSPIERQPIVKFRNPWLIKTAPGYSTLFVQPFNRFGIPFVPLAGVVETDTYYRMIHFPAVCTLPVNTSYTLRAGTPIIQAIPFRRDQWSSVMVPADEVKMAEFDREFGENPHLYKDRYWVRHEFK